MCLQSLMKFYHCLLKILKKNQNVVDKEWQRAITVTEIAPGPYFSIINVHLVDINVLCLQNLMKFHHCLFKLLLKEKPKCRWLRLTKGNNSKRIGSEPFFLYYKCSPLGYQCVCQILWNSIIDFSRYWKTKTLRMDRRTDGECDNSIPPPPNKHSLPVGIITKGKMAPQSMNMWTIIDICNYNIHPCL